MSVKKRIIPLLTTIDSRLVKSIKFDKLIDVGDPIKTAKIFNDSDADELILLNIKRNNRTVSDSLKLIDKIAKNCFMPLSVGGGIRSYVDAKNLFNSGADKVIINSATFENKKLIEEISINYGSQSIIVSLDFKKNGNLYDIYSECGTYKQNIYMKKYIDEIEKIGIGEIFINSIDSDGSMKGFDLNLFNFVSQYTKAPLIGCGGAGNFKHLKDAFLNCNLSAVACGSLFNFGDNNPIRAKNYLSNYNLDFKLVNQ